MGRWSVREVPWSGRAAQTEPFAALVAVFVVGMALAVHAAAFEAALPGPGDQSVAGSTADRLERALSTNGVVVPDALSQLDRLGPGGYETNVTVEYANTSVSAGPPPPPAADAAAREVSVRKGFGDVRPGRLEVRVWH